MKCHLIREKKISTRMQSAGYFKCILMVNPEKDLKLDVSPYSTFCDHLGLLNQISGINCTHVVICHYK